MSSSISSRVYPTPSTSLNPSNFFIFRRFPFLSSSASSSYDMPLKPRSVPLTPGTELSRYFGTCLCFKRNKVSSHRKPLFQSPPQRSPNPPLSIADENANNKAESLRVSFFDNASLSVSTATASSIASFTTTESLVSFPSTTRSLDESIWSASIGCKDFK